jgi:hypothetical protein
MNSYSWVCVVNTVVSRALISRQQIIFENDETWSPAALALLLAKKHQGINQVKPTTGFQQ